MSNKSYPRLIFASERPTRSIDSEVISDLKLDLLFSAEVSEILLARPEKDTLLARQEAFSLLLADESAEDKLKCLSEALSMANELYRALITAESEKTAAFIFVSLLARTDDFYRQASELGGYGKLFFRFSGAMSALRSDSEFAEAASEAKRLLPTIREANELTLKTENDKTRVLSGGLHGIARALLDCAAELDIEINSPDIAPFALQKPIADSVGVIYREQTEAATRLLQKHRAQVTGELFDYVPELNFLISMLSFAKEMRRKGIPCSFPALCEDKTLDLRNVYDVTLTKKDGTEIIPNDVYFDEKEPFFFLTGANGGGKTTYIRAVGGATLLFLAGAPVFCEGGKAPLLSAVYTHFPRDERFEGTGRFLDEKKRVDSILEKQDGNALVLLNETFATTGEEKAVEQTALLADALFESGCLGLYITHQHTLTKTEIPFLGVTVDENDSNRRTYKIEKRRLAPKSFARDILEKYHLDKDWLAKRFP